MVRDEASGSSTGKGVATAHVMTGNPAHDRTSDTSLCEDGGGGGDAGGKRNGEHDLTKHSGILPAMCIAYIIHSPVVAKSDAMDEPTVPGQDAGGVLPSGTGTTFHRRHSTMPYIPTASAAKMNHCTA